MKYADIEKNYKALEGVATKQFPRKMVTAIARNLSKMKPIMEEISNQRMDITRKYAQKKEDGNIDYVQIADGLFSIKFESSDDKQKYESEIAELLEMEEDIEAIKIDESILDMLDMGGYDKLTAKDEIDLGFMINYE